ncbi:hypothetical protein SAMN05421858_4830 [Haladaptatus litoreus]|uniref:Uncharacterized protein n=1 Tax=Haladaptatus litoreus TaxID=553468 RepID=A0A1N7F8U5_9EURY|nr:hypothetical protein SAMN05421858_4830 [Haladaptatus litoreus]
MFNSTRVLLKLYWADTLFSLTVQFVRSKSVIVI